MSKPLILNPAQAKAVYDAMCALNNVSAKLKAMFGDVSKVGVNVYEEDGGWVNVVRVTTYYVMEYERHANQADFAAAYGLQ